MKVRFTPAAEADFLAALEYIRRDSPSAAVRFRERAWDSLQRLLEFPESGRVVPEFPLLPHREIFVRPYRFFYRIKGNVVWIVGVWHDAQLPSQPPE